MPAASKVLAATLTLDNPGITETVIRTLGRYLVQSDQAAGVEFQLGAWGMIVINDLAVAAGAASIPGPVTDASDDGWFVWEPFSTFGTRASAVGQWQDVHFESKAARRVEEGFTIAIMVENAHASDGLLFTLGASVLSKVNT